MQQVLETTPENPPPNMATPANPAQVESTADDGHSFLIENGHSFLIEKSYRVPVPPAVFMGFIANPANDLRWQSSCDRVQPDQPGQSCRTGSTYRIWFAFFGKKMEFQMRCDQRQERTFSYTTVKGPVSFSGHYQLQPGEGDATDVTWSFRVIPGRFFGVVPRSLLKKALCKQIDNDIARLQDLMQALADSPAND